jgi:hypothetical protein
MKALTRKTPSPKTTAKAARKPLVVAPRRAEAQCCAKQSRTVAGCHD